MGVLDRMRVALFTDTFLPEINGVATSTANLAKTLREHGNAVLVVCTNPFDKELRYEEEEGILRIPGMELKKIYGYRLTGFYNKTAMRIVREFAPDIIHIQTDVGVGTFGNLAAARLGVGKIYTYHTMIEDYAYYITKGHFDRFARHVVRLFFRGKSTLFDEIIAPSDKSKDYLRSIGIDSPISVIPTGIELTRFTRSNENKAKTAMLKKKYGIGPDETVLLSLGRIAEEKSIDVLLRGYAKFLSENPAKKTKFVITGWGPAEDGLKVLATSLKIDDHVIFTGKSQQDKTQEFYHMGDIFLCASLTETQGLTFMEAMAAQLLVLARYDDNLAGTIKDGETGKFFFDENDFPAKLNEVLSMDPITKENIIENALRSVDEYSMENFYKRIIEVYARVQKKYW